MTTTLSAIVFSLATLAAPDSTKAPVPSCPQLAPAVQQFCAPIRTDAEHYLRAQRFQPAYRLQTDPVDVLLQDAYRAGAIDRTQGLERGDLVKLNAFIKAEAERRAVPAQYVVRIA